MQADLNKPHEVSSFTSPLLLVRNMPKKGHKVSQRVKKSNPKPNLAKRSPNVKGGALHLDLCDTLSCLSRLSIHLITLISGHKCKGLVWVSTSFL